MKKIAFLIAGIQLAVSAAQAASFDCEKASTEVERSICDDSELGGLDETLGRVFERNLLRLADPDGQRAAQREWLREVRDQCHSIPCLKAVYRQRLRELATPSVMDEAKARAICDEVAGAVSDGSLVGRFERFVPPESEVGERWAESAGSNGPNQLKDQLEVDYDADGVTEMLGHVAYDEERGYGDCWIVDLAHPDHYPDDEKGNALMGLRNGCDNQKLLFVRGEPITVSGIIWNVPEIDFVTWLAPGGGKQALCYLDGTNEVNVRIVESKDPALCEAVAEGRIELVEWYKEKKIYGGTTVTMPPPLAKIDLDLDGVEDTLTIKNFPLGYFSGDRCYGCNSHQWMLETRHAVAGAVSDLDRTLRALSMSWGPMVLNSGVGQWFEPKPFFYDGKPYLLGRGPQSDAAAYSIWNGEVNTLCEFELSHVHQVKKTFPLKSRHR